MSLLLLKYVLKACGPRRTQTQGSIEGVVPTFLLKYILKVCKKREIIPGMHGVPSLYIPARIFDKISWDYEGIGKGSHRGFIVYIPS